MPRAQGKIVIENCRKKLFRGKTATIKIPGPKCENPLMLFRFLQLPEKINAAPLRTTIFILYQQGNGKSFSVSWTCKPQAN
jgi:hypothetical protein